MEGANNQLRKKYVEILKDMHDIVMHPGEIRSINAKAKWVVKFSKDDNRTKA